MVISVQDEGASSVEAVPPIRSRSTAPQRAPGVPTNSLTSYDLGAFRVMRSLIDTSDPSRTAAFIPWDWADQAGHVSVRLILDGEQRVNFGREPVELAEGDLCLCEPGYPLATEVRRCEILTVALERDRLDNPKGSLHGLVLRGDHPLAQLLGGHLHRLLHTLPGLTLSTLAPTVHVTLSLLHNCLGLQCGALETAVDGDPLRARIIAFIESHVHAPDLSARLLQREFNLSRARLYRIMEPEGGVARVIARARTDAAFRDIRHRPEQPLLKVAERWGFSNLRQFQRAFRARFGFSPGTLRQPQWRVRSDASIAACPAPESGASVPSVQVLPVSARAASSAK